MKRLLYTVILTALLGCMVSCMQNDGYIGPLFGQWRLEEVATENHIEECDTIFFSFQSNLFQVRKIIYNSYDYTAFTGLYERNEEMIKFNFLNHNSNDITTHEDTVLLLNDLQTLYIHEVSPIFTIEKLNNKEMILNYNNYNYIFRKLN